MVRLVSTATRVACAIFLFHSIFFLNFANAIMPRVFQRVCETVLTYSNPKNVEFISVQDVDGLLFLKGTFEDFLAQEQNINVEDIYRIISQNKRSVLFHPHEVSSSLKYATHLYKEHGHYLVLVPSIGGRFIPGFDGIVLDHNKKPIANFSLKTLQKAHSTSGFSLITEHAPRYSSGLGRAFDAISKAVDYSRLRSWIELGYQQHYNDPEHRNQANLDIDWLKESIQFFGIRAFISSSRPTRIVVDLANKLAEMPSDEELFEVSHHIMQENGLIESVVYIKNREIVEVHAPIAGSE